MYSLRERGADGDERSVGCLRQKRSLQVPGVPERVREEKEAFLAKQSRSLWFWSRYDFSMLYISCFRLFYPDSC